MTREETKKIIMAVQAAYPNWKIEDKQTLLNVWSYVFIDDDYETIQASLMHYIRNDRSGFPPAAGQIRTQIRDVLDDYDDTEEKIADLWRAVRNANYHAQEEFDRLDPVLQKAVGGASKLRVWAMMDESELENVAFSHVRRAYRSIKEREKRITTLQPVTKSILEQAEWTMIQETGRPLIGGRP